MAKDRTHFETMMKLIKQYRYTDILLIYSDADKCPLVNVCYLQDHYQITDLTTREIFQCVDTNAAIHAIESKLLEPAFC
ncbi:hypothetical protein V1498_11640 [Peribacillus sp. SCS-26]|uniref:hypothetical protein n=1 Tax=Paraperibacillus marinus TaxID=3115295 RepID=UPI00390626C9